jgi:prolipoprotein diacylglyceryltransferase
MYFVAALGFSLLIGLLVLGWRDRKGIELGDQQATLLSILAGIQFGVLWKLVEFVLDWVWNADLQKSNTETVVDLLWNDVGAVVGAVLSARLYCHVANASQRAKLGAVATWLVSGPSRGLDRHGGLVTIVLAVLASLTVAGLWLAGRPVPGFGNG